MSRPKGLPKTGGRTAGTPNHATSEVKSLARQHGAEMIKVLASIAKNTKKPDASRVAAAKELLDRGYGRAITMLSGPDEGPIPVKNTVDLSGLSPEQLRAIAAIKVD